MKKLLSVFLAVAIMVSCLNITMITVSSITDYTTVETENVIELKGVLKSDFIADNPESVYVLSGNLEIAENVTFSLQNGVKVFGNGNELNVYGTFNANNATISDSKIVARNKNEKPCSISIINCSVTGGELLPPTGNSTHCNLTLKNCSFKNIDSYTYIWYPTSDVHIVGNVFHNCGCISVGSSKNIYIRYNSFYDFAYNSLSCYNHKIVIDWAQYGDTNCFFEYNNIYNEKEYKEIVGLQPGYDNSSMTALNNYWGTSDISKIQSYILDINLDYSCAGEVKFLPIKENEIDISHYEHEEVIDKGYPPKCTEEGLSDGSHCSVCGEVIKAQEVVPSTGHTSVIDKSKAPTCTETGLTEGSHCSVCGDIIKAQEIVPATGHTPVKDSAVPAECTHTGLTEGSHCSACGEILKAQEEVPALGHKPVIDPYLVPTCQHEGHTLGSHCENCGEIYVAYDVIPKLPHTIITDEAVAPSCGKTGLTQGSHCSVCGEVIVAQKVVSALTHEYEMVPAVPTSYLKEGATEGVRCKHCGEWLIEPQVIPKLPIDFIYGDADGDGRVNVQDVTAIQRYLADINILTIKQLGAADTNGDGEINIADATHVQMYLAEFDGIVLGKQPTA